ncbi:MAG TPA: TetR/AcrR family transcriptional regulator [Gordonia sp. (in: high G+C Gram-positive bacteria)]|uniref:TetR/AcrR family transcriptional regulator n=1 Tax=unclassified Gordonia (in: high G+C Gram-positive bacteria) TaxID=2657482 RepID=UPI000FBACB72|nr:MULTISPECIES: TetR/AcrR family transcriptional regulator [unclassified Gordonia (in: high G+C Gram-positive bacteria)]RUP39302.1 MAG: TetR/AcrR family transcriptional regulator [Gordonia sp. (in: high G+C Gram-positive bacteria)]HNP55727.1 TetR/AcrR family transcriptional regulator [Gordonia sp. (in: high G+C Gram-positive bacteria)]HRC49463.1 TetR/AcrR family transcriptional regulator [Gordonia sp. (in: high G+C Gram-positive bacteria)]
MMAPRPRSSRGSGEQLRGEIIDAAMVLLAEHDSADAVSVRAVAEAVGVTPPAIYLHFADKEALLDSVCGRYFERLDVALGDAEDQHEHPLDRTLAMGMTYVRFALDNPAVYRFAFGNPGDDGTPMVDEALQTTAFGRLAGAVGSLVDLGWFPPGPPGHDDVSVLQMAMQMWTVAHGVASLMIAKPALPWGDDLQVAESVLRAACLGNALLPAVGEKADGADFVAFVRDTRAAHREHAE